MCKRVLRSLLLGDPSFLPSQVQGGVGWAGSQEALPPARRGTLTLFHTPGSLPPVWPGPAVSSQNGHRGHQKGCCLSRAPRPMTGQEDGWGPGPSGHRKGGGGLGLGSLGWDSREHVLLCPGRGRRGETDAGCPRLPLPQPLSCPLPALTTGHQLPGCWGPSRPLHRPLPVGITQGPTLVFIFTDGGIGGSGCWDESLSLRGNAGHAKWAAVLPPQRVALKPWTSLLPCLFTPHPQLSSCLPGGPRPLGLPGSPFLLILALSRSCARAQTALHPMFSKRDLAVPMIQTLRPRGGFRCL